MSIETRKICRCAPDCRERIECRRAGEVGHFACGWCAHHDQARHICFCQDGGDA